MASGNSFIYWCRVPLSKLFYFILLFKWAYQVSDFLVALSYVASFNLRLPVLSPIFLSPTPTKTFPRLVGNGTFVFLELAVREITLTVFSGLKLYDTRKKTTLKLVTPVSVEGWGEWGGLGVGKSWVGGVKRVLPSQEMIMIIQWQVLAISWSQNIHYVTQKATYCKLSTLGVTRRTSMLSNRSVCVGHQ